MDQKPDKEKLKKYREKVLKILGKPELLELTEIKELLQELIKKEVVERKVITRETLPDLTSVIKKLDEILNKEPLKIEQKNVHFPVVMKTKVTNFPDKPVKVEVTNNPEIDWFKPFKWLWDNLEKILTPSLNKIISLISEPDKTEINRTGYGYIQSITDHYGNRKVTYQIERNDTNKIKSVIRSEK